MNKKKTLWQMMGQLSLDTTLSENERTIFLTAQQALNNGDYDEKVAADLKTQLGKLAMQRKLSPRSVDFFTELSRLYLGFGRRDNINLGP